MKINRVAKQSSCADCSECLFGKAFRYTCYSYFSGAAMNVCRRRFISLSLFHSLRTLFSLILSHSHPLYVFPTHSPLSIALHIYICGSINIMPLIICAYQHVSHACGCKMYMNTFVRKMWTSNEVHQH